jgi:hypothetical protein
MEHLDKILEMSEAEFGAMAKNGKFKSREEIDSVYKLMDIVKDVYCIWDMEEGSGDDMSYNDGSYRNGPYRNGSYRGSYNDGSSYARGRGRNARRDSMGRYSREGSYRDGRSYRMDGYSRADGKQEYIENLRDMMEDAPDDQTRQSIQRMIQQMEQA